MTAVVREHKQNTQVQRCNQYDQSPQQIRLEEEDAAVNLTADDSISFRNVPAPAVVAQAPVCEVKTKRLSTPRGMDFKVILPDGSEVWLNAESTIEFPTAFHDGLRQVRLQGEAYFKVAHDERSPFIVTSEQMNVRVLGTSFNFRNYASEKAHVTLVEGKVEVMHPESTTPDATLEPGEEAWFDEEGTLRVEEADTYAVTQWVKGFFYFPDDPLVDVLREWDGGTTMASSSAIWMPSISMCTFRLSAMKASRWPSRA